jgi:NADH-quinone oxidoreductase subunit L
MGSILLAMIGLPLVGSILNGLIIRTPHPKRAGVIATLFAGASFVMALSLWSGLHNGPIAISWDWFSAGATKINMGFMFDSFTASMALIVTGIGTLIHLYSIGYMSHEPTPSRYFAYLNLFLFNMLILICGDSLPVMFVGCKRFVLRRI